MVVNGMSRFARDGANANAALLVGGTPDDFPGTGPLAGVELQRMWEERAFALGGGDYTAPAQTVGAFLGRKGTPDGAEGRPTYPLGVSHVDIGQALPPYVAATLREALPVFGRKIRGFDSSSALLTGIETRSSAPLRILRGEDRQSAVRGIFPCGEGAGYAGGIMSSAIDGIRCAEALLRSLA